MIKTYRTLSLMLAALAFSSPGWAASDVAGMVKTRAGEVFIERAGERLAADVGQPLLVSDRLRTGSDGRIGVTLRDNTLLSAGPNSLIVVDKFLFDSTTQDGRLSVGVRKGTLAVATGKIARQTPQSVDFHTPTSVLGVRGTEFVIEVEGGSND